MSLGADDPKAAGVFDPLRVLFALADEVLGRLGDRGIAALGIGEHLLRTVLQDVDPSEHLGIATEHDVGASTRHVGGHGHGARRARLRDHIRLALVLLGVEHVVWNALAIEKVRHRIRLLDARRADQYGLTPLVCESSSSGADRA